MAHSLQIFCIVANLVTMILTLLAAFTPGWVSGGNAVSFSDLIDGNTDLSGSKVVEIDFGLFFLQAKEILLVGAAKTVISISPITWINLATLILLIKAAIWQLFGVYLSKKALNFSKYDNVMLAKTNMYRSIIFMGFSSISVLIGMLVYTFTSIFGVNNYISEALISDFHFNYSFYLGWAALGAALLSSVLCAVTNKLVMKGDSSIQHVPMI